MYEHLGTWKRNPATDESMRLDLWDTGRIRDGKSELRYALWISPPADQFRGTIIEGEDFCPSPFDAIDSDATAAALLSFFAAYGESIRYSGDEADVPEGLTGPQREALAAHHDELAMWENELDNVEPRTDTPLGL
jgi:hypothetical protein